MARVLQIRRGTTAQNDNFTGMPGEISVDMDAKVLRVHDGETLGGFALARADQIGDTGGDTPGAEFDINSVPDEFWAQKFAQFGGASFNIVTGPAMPLFNTTYLEAVLSATTTPHFIRAYLTCQTAEAGYAADDICTAFGIGTYATPIFNTFVDHNGLHVRLAIGQQTFWVAHKSTGEKTDITNANWKIQFRVYC